MLLKVPVGIGTFRAKPPSGIAGASLRLKRTVFLVAAPSVAMTGWSVPGSATANAPVTRLSKVTRMERVSAGSSVNTSRATAPA